MAAIVLEHHGGEERSAGVHAGEGGEPPALRHDAEEEGAREAHEDRQRFFTVCIPAHEAGDSRCEVGTCAERQCHEGDVLEQEQKHRAYCHVAVGSGGALPRGESRETQDVVDGCHCQDELTGLGPDHAHLGEDEVRDPHRGGYDEDAPPHGFDEGGVGRVRPDEEVVEPTGHHDAKNGSQIGPPQVVDHGLEVGLERAQVEHQHHREDADDLHAEVEGNAFRERDLRIEEVVRELLHSWNV